MLPFSSGKSVIDYLILRLETYPQDGGTRPLEELTAFLAQFELLEWDGADVVPELGASIDGHHLDQQAALAVAQQHHAPHGGVPAVGVKPGDRGAQCLSKPGGGVGNGIAGVIVLQRDFAFFACGGPR
jgi:hypothetical protein